jgi:hypothetical protein
MPKVTMAFCCAAFAARATSSLNRAGSVMT